MNQEKTGRFIAENRKKKNMTQEELAEKIGISKNAVSKWERGLNLPDASKMPELCSILGISLNEFFAGEYIDQENIEKQSESNILEIVKKENSRTIRSRIIISVLTFLILIAAVFLARAVLIQTGRLPDPSLAYTQRYETGRQSLKGDVDYSMFESISMDFEIGANKYGYAVFKDPARAYKKLKRDCSAGIKAIQKEFHLAPLNLFNFEEYGSYGWQLAQGTEEEKQQGKFITKFFDIYENSLN